MTRYIIYSDTVGFDGELKSTSTNYNTARNGTGTFSTVAVSDGWGIVGQSLASGTYTIAQMFFQFDLSSVPSTDLIVSSFFNFFNRTTAGAAGRDIEVRERDFGASLTNADWVTPATFGTLPYYGDITGAQQAAGGVTGLRGGSTALNNRIATGSDTLRVVACTSRFRAGNAPTTANPTETNSIYHSSASGTVNDPMLVVETVNQHALVHVGGQSCIQLRNGNHFFLEFNGSIVAPAIVGKYHNGTSASIVVTLSLTESFDADYYALQRYALCADNADNIYILGQNGGDENRLSGKALVKNVGSYTWIEKATISYEMPTYFTAGSSVINNITSVWHSTGGAGTVMAFIGHQAWTSDTNMLQYAAVSCAALQAGSGTMVTRTGSLSEVVDLKSSTELIAYPNETGTGLDCTTQGSYPGNGNKGNILTYDSDNLAKFSSYFMGGPTQNPGDDGYATVFNVPIVKEPNSKARMIPMDINRYTAIAGNKMIVYLWNGGILASLNMSDAGVASIPSASQFTSTTNWDAVYDPASNKLYVYYLDFADANRLMRTSYDMSAYAWTGEETEVDAAIGAGGSTNYSVRCPRHWIYGRRVQVAVSNVAAGVHSTVYNYDNINVAPTSPTLTTKSPYDADDPGTFKWTFNDPNQSDAQSAYQLQVWNVGATVLIYDSGKVTNSVAQHVIPASTLTNNVNYQWKVRTYDLDDVVSGYSPYGTFNTSNAAIVTITFPATDNPPDYQQAEVPLQWSVSGATQDHYRLRVYVNADNTLFSDTGSVASSQGVRTVTGLVSGVEYRFELVVTSVGVDSNTAIRLLTPDYATPEIPIINVTPMDDLGYMLIAITNPSPDGDRPEVSQNLIYRTNNDDETTEAIGYVNAGSAYYDYTAASGVSYTYQVRAISADGYSSQSTPDTKTLRLIGLWVHDPLSPASTIRQYRYGKDTRADSLSVAQQAQKFAGRTSPVYYFGEQEDNSMSARIDFLPENQRTEAESVRKFVRMRRTLCVRENRGRKLFGVLDGARNDDNNAGSSMSFTVNKVDYDESVV